MNDESPSEKGFSSEWEVIRVGITQMNRVRKSIMASGKMLL